MSRSIGWEVYKDDKVLKIADTIDEENNSFGVTAFPNGVAIARRLISKGEVKASNTTMVV